MMPKKIKFFFSIVPLIREKISIYLFLDIYYNLSILLVYRNISIYLNSQIICLSIFCFFSVTILNVLAVHVSAIHIVNAWRGINCG